MQDTLQFLEDTGDEGLELEFGVIVIVSLEIELDALVVLEAEDPLDIQTVENPVQLDQSHALPGIPVLGSQVLQVLLLGPGHLLGVQQQHLPVHVFQVGVLVQHQLLHQTLVHQFVQF